MPSIRLTISSDLQNCTNVSKTLLSGFRKREESRYYELQDKLINFVNKMQVKLLSSSKKLNERIDRTVPIFVLGEQKTERIKSFESSKFQLIVTNVSIAAVDL